MRPRPPPRRQDGVILHKHLPSRVVKPILLPQAAADLAAVVFEKLLDVVHDRGLFLSTTRG